MKRIILSIAAIVSLAMVSCKKNLLDINQNPNSATYSTPQLTMPVAIENAARVYQRSYTSLGWWMCIYGGSAGFSKPNVEYNYDVNSTFLAGVWDNLYNNLEDLDYVEQQAKTQKLPVYEAISKLLKAYDYQQLVDLWGNVPYSQALKASSNFSPAYDNGQTIYEDLVKKIDTAIVILKKPATEGSISVATDGARIIMFNDVLKSSGAAAFLNKWVKFANSLKLRLLVQQSQMTGRDAYIKSELAGLTRADFLDLKEDGVENPGYQNDASKFNPFYGIWYSTTTSLSDTYKSTKAGDFRIGLLNSTYDTLRAPFFYDKGTSAKYVGSVLGDPVGAAAASMGKGILDPAAPAVVMTASESLFLQAEAVQRGYMVGNAQQLYADAVLSSFQYAKVANPVTAASTYIGQANADVNWTLATDKIKLIITQKYIALTSIDILSIYNDYRRTGFPNVPLSIDATSKGKVPVRLLYPQREIQLNGANVTAQGNVDPLTTTVFWDK